MLLISCFNKSFIALNSATFSYSVVSVIGVSKTSVSVLPPPHEINSTAKKLNVKILFIIQLKKRVLSKILKGLKVNYLKKTIYHLIQQQFFALTPPLTQGYLLIIVLLRLYLDLT